MEIRNIGHIASPQMLQKDLLYGRNSAIELFFCSAIEESGHHHKAL